MNFLRKTYLNTRLSKYLTKNFRLELEVFAVVTYLDKEIKDIEILDSDILINRLINHTYPDLTEKEEELLEEYSNNFYISELKKFKVDEHYFEVCRQEVLSQVKKLKNKKIKENVLMIVKSDGIITEDESDFLNELSKSLQKD